MLVCRVEAGLLGVGEDVYQTKKPTATRFGTSPYPSLPEEKALYQPVGRLAKL